MSEKFLRLLRASNRILAVAFIVGLVVGIIRGFVYLRNGFHRAFISQVLWSIPQICIYLVIGSLCLLFLFRQLRGRFSEDHRTALVAVLIPAIPIFFAWIYYLNRHVLPLFFSWTSISWNILLCVSFLIVVYCIATVLKWETGVWGRTPSFRSAYFFVGWIVAFLAVVFVIPALIRPETSEQRPNVILILVDALRADRLSCYGYSRQTSPNIDKLSRDSVLFSQAISQSSYTKTSIASLFTALYPHRHGVRRFTIQDNRVLSEKLSANFKTLAETLLDKGYLTVSWIEQPQLSSYMGFSQGFVVYKENQKTLPEFGSRFLSWADHVGKTQPFFSYLHSFDVHNPYTPRVEYARLYTGSILNTAEAEALSRRVDHNFNQATDSERSILSDHYDAEITQMDNDLGKILAKLKQLGLYDTSIIVLTSDHGEGFMEHGHMFHSRTPHDELIRVPLIIKFPHNRFAGSKILKQVRSIDVMPTILESVGSTPASEIDGVSLMGLVRNDSGTNIPSIAVSEIQKTISLRREDHKLIRYPDGKKELFDLVSDPGEKNNIYGESNPVLESFEPMLTYIIPAMDKESTEKVEVTADDVEKLKSLGYIE